MQDTPLAFRRASIVLSLPVVMAMMQPGIQKFAVSTLSMGAGDAICTSTHCQARRPANGLAVNDLLAAAPPGVAEAALPSNGPGRVALTMEFHSQKAGIARALRFVADPWMHMRALLCALTRETVHFAYFLISGLSGASTPTQLDLKFLASLNPHGDRASQCPVVRASRPAAGLGAG